MIKHIHRKTTRSPEESARLRADRERYQRDKPTPEQLLAEGDRRMYKVKHEQKVAQRERNQISDVQALHAALQATIDPNRAGATHA